MAEVASGLSGRKVALHVSGGVAVVKVPELITALRRLGAEVRVAMTPSATRLISPTTLRALSGNPVSWRLVPERGETDEAGPPAGHGMTHLDLASWADCNLVVPATASTIAKLALGLADDVVAATLLSSRAPLLLAPGMETGMWRHPATRANLETLRSRGAEVVGPVSGRLASGKEGEGRLAEPQEILARLERLLGGPGSMAGWGVLVTAGGTREAIDPVRYLGNRSSGRMGEALARAAAIRGAQVTLVTAQERAPQIAGVQVVPVETAAELLGACLERLSQTRLLLMAAAVADFRLEAPSPVKLHRRGRDSLELRLVPTVDVLGELAAGRPSDCLLVGFAAESEEVAEGGRRKLEEKGLDLVVANPVTGPHSAMGGEMAQAHLLGRDGSRRDVAWQAKAGVAAAILDEVERIALLPPRSGESATR